MLVVAEVSRRRNRGRVVVVIRRACILVNEVPTVSDQGGIDKAMTGRNGFQVVAAIVPSSLV